MVRSLFARTNLIPLWSPPLPAGNTSLRVCPPRSCPIHQIRAWSHHFALVRTLFQLGPIMFSLGLTLFRLGPIMFRLGPTIFWLGPTSFQLGPTSFQLGPVMFWFSPTMFWLGSTSFRLGPPMFRLGPITFTTRSNHVPTWFDHAQLGPPYLLFGPHHIRLPWFWPSLACPTHVPLGPITFSVCLIRPPLGLVRTCSNLESAWFDYISAWSNLLPAWSDYFLAWSKAWANLLPTWSDLVPAWSNLVLAWSDSFWLDPTSFWLGPTSFRPLVQFARLVRSRFGYVQARPNSSLFCLIDLITALSDHILSWFDHVSAGSDQVPAWSNLLPAWTNHILARFDILLVRPRSSLVLLHSGFSRPRFGLIDSSPRSVRLLLISRKLLQGRRKLLEGRKKFLAGRRKLLASRKKLLLGLRKLPVAHCWYYWDGRRKLLDGRMKLLERIVGRYWRGRGVAGLQPELLACRRGRSCWSGSSKVVGWPKKVVKAHREVVVCGRWMLLEDCKVVGINCREIKAIVRHKKLLEGRGKRCVKFIKYWKACQRLSVWKAVGSCYKAVVSCWMALGNCRKALRSYWRAAGSCWRAEKLLDGRIKMLEGRLKMLEGRRRLLLAIEVIGENRSVVMCRREVVEPEVERGQKMLRSEEVVERRKSCWRVREAIGCMRKLLEQGQEVVVALKLFSGRKGCQRTGKLLEWSEGNEDVEATSKMLEVRKLLVVVGSHGDGLRRCWEAWRVASAVESCWGRSMLGRPLEDVGRLPKSRGGLKSLEAEKDVQALGRLRSSRMPAQVSSCLVACKELLVAEEVVEWSR
ncbi:hypothetical protein FNV43_RR23727 [Rhamnella rubrinervis]|uniref:Uncharacterized protein n=1 Tax=Rhamnella rubrinervis TaxID=2594499 RepID=A0A8K0GSG6_9ROSA|nr:hypothetical protein FNV43_RR23727 [Rhamnella rubrinervis]